MTYTLKCYAVSSFSAAARAKVVATRIVTLTYVDEANDVYQWTDENGGTYADHPARGIAATNDAAYQADRYGLTD